VQKEEKEKKKEKEEAMSKPLIFVIQLIGACMLLIGAPSAIAREGFGLFLAGCVLMVIGGIEWRKRTRKG
jgi:flagellar basal body-associated protein FliL